MFKQAIVLEVIANPQLFSDENIKLLLKHYGVEDINQNYDVILPNNTIIVTYANIVGQFSGKPIICFPFFSSHTIFPIKAGERVWVYDENIPTFIADHVDGNVSVELPKQTYYAYWISRISEPRIAEDVNLTHADRKQNDSNRSKSTTSKKVYEFINGGTPKDDKTDNSSGLSLLLDNTRDSYNYIINNSIANQLVQLEAVPKLYPRPGEYIIQGSNNSYIMLGSDRELTKPEISEKPLIEVPLFWNKKTQSYNTSVIGNKQVVDEKTKSVNFPTIKKIKKENTGTIDIVAGKVTKSDGFFKTISIDSEKRTELEKMPNASEEKTGINAFLAEDIQNFESDKSRIYVSEKTNCNKNFGLTWQPNLDTQDGVAAIIQKSDNIKIIGRKELGLIFQEKSTTSKSDCSYLLLNKDFEVKTKNDGKISIGNGTDELLKTVHDALKIIVDLAENLILTSTGPGQLNPAVKLQLNTAVNTLKKIGKI